MRGVLVLAVAAAGLVVFRPAPERGEWERIHPPRNGHGQAASLGVQAYDERPARTGRSAAIFWNGRPGAIYSPARRRWRRLPPPPPPLRYWKPTDTLTWTGREAIAFGGTAPHDAGHFVKTAAAYGPATRRWRMLPPVPIAGRDRHAAVWTARDLLVWGGCCGGGRHHRDGAFYTPR